MMPFFIESLPNFTFQSEIFLISILFQFTKSYVETVGVDYGK